MGFSYWECYNLPVRYRIWFLERLQKEIKGSEDSRAAHTNSPEARALMNKSRPQTPAKLRRFT